MQTVLRSPRFWGTFLSIVALFAVTGPYGTRETMMPAERLGYWLAIHAVTWTIAIGASVLADWALKPHLPNTVLRMLVGSLMAALPIGLSLVVLDALLRDGPLALDLVPWRAAQSLPLCALFCILTILTLRPESPASSDVSVLDWPLPASDGEGSQQPAGLEPEIAPPAPILARLKPHHRGPLLRLSVEDHYTEIVTTRGRELVLLRFSDALREIGATPGLRLHRSHWVADAFVADLRREDGRLIVIGQDGSALPVSRSYQDAVRQHFANK
ncbi:hypothetical protein BJF93_11510 [Xaviernesmea oryzae]|uniref:HTH LytTR-type domain-containing protein n=2 Tax=Xaviernesmea oryzae TaxID=464029 RepID=A0A1Q9AV76_9HYPH|nr:hypothetical protein BJF93_11510 [Xaviernesmea oryzae]SEL63420.1 LytTr DNA-binding domain-containing protein [Xaviernesmea oryzae]